MLSKRIGRSAGRGNGNDLPGIARSAWRTYVKTSVHKINIRRIITLIRGQGHGRAGLRVELAINEENDNKKART